MKMRQRRSISFERGEEGDKTSTESCPISGTKRSWYRLVQEDISQTDDVSTRAGERRPCRVVCASKSMLERNGCGAV